MNDEANAEVTQHNQPDSWISRVSAGGWQQLVPGARMLKTALAVGLSWWLAGLLGETQPMFAAMGALFGMELTIIGSLRRTGLQLVGIVGVVGIAVLLAYAMGVNAIGIGFAVLLGLWISSLAQMPDRVGVELGVTALLVVVFGRGDLGFGAARLWETALGGLVAVIINTVLFPPNYLGQVAESTETLGGRLANGLRETMRAFALRPDHQGAREALQRARSARSSVPEIEERLRLSAEALRLNPLRRGEMEGLHRYQEALRLYTRTSYHASTLARVVRQHAARPHSWPHEGLESPTYLLRVVDGLAGALESYQLYVRTGSSEKLAEAERRAEEARSALREFPAVAGRDQATTPAVGPFVDAAAIASELEHLSLDIDEALESAALGTEGG